MTIPSDALQRKAARIGGQVEYAPAPWNHMAPPPPTIAVALLEPPADLARGNELWIAAGSGAGWGGCEVWASLDNASYEKVGLITQGGVVGILATPLPIGSDPDTANSVMIDVAMSQGVIYTGSDNDADQFVTGCFANGEFFSHTAATLVAPHQYRFDRRIRRGSFKSEVKHHPTGTQFVKFNQAIFRFPYPAHVVGQTVYIKLPSVNEHQQMLQNLDLAQAYSITLAGVK